MTQRRQGLAALAFVASLCASLPRPALAGERASFHAAAGALWPSELPAGLWFAAGAALPWWRLSVEPELGYWSRSETAFGLRASVRDIEAGLSLTATLLRVGRARLFAGGGGTAHFVQNSGGPVTGSTGTENVVRPGLQALVGIEADVGRLALFAAFRADWIHRTDAASEHETRVCGGLRIPF